MKRGPYAKVKERNTDLLKKIRHLKTKHPYWGYRRIWAYLKFKEKMQIGKNRVYRLMQKEDLIVKRNHALRAKRTHSRPKPRPCQPNEWWGIDMTKVMIEGFGWPIL